MSVAGSQFPGGDKGPIDSTHARAVTDGAAGRAPGGGRRASSVGAALALLGVAAFPGLPLSQLVLPFAISFAAIAPFAFVLKPRLAPFLAGASLVAVLAALIELEAGNLAGDLVGPVLVLLLIAPVTEELLKLGVSGLTGATFRTAAGAALGFAATENAIYYIAAWNGPVLTLALLVIIRSFTDPLVHVDATTLTTSSWRGNAAGLPAGILLHIGWNTLSLVLVAFDPLLALGVFAVGIVALIALLALLHQSRSARLALSERRSLFPWLGVGT